TCNAGVCQQNYSPPGTNCGSSANNACTNPDTCNGSGTCLPNHESNGTVCGTEVCDWNTCSYSNICSNWGSRSGTCTSFTCSGGACMQSTRSATDERGCDRDTDGRGCATCSSCVNQECVGNLCGFQ